MFLKLCGVSALPLSDRWAPKPPQAGGFSAPQDRYPPLAARHQERHLSASQAHNAGPQGIETAAARPAQPQVARHRDRRRTARATPGCTASNPRQPQTAKRPHKAHTEPCRGVIRANGRRLSGSRHARGLRNHPCHPSHQRQARQHRRAAAYRQQQPRW